MNSTVIEYLSARNEQILALLRKMVLIQSGTHHKQGVDDVARLIIEFCQPMSVHVKTIEQEPLGNHLIIRSVADPPAQKQILLTGHMDTVFPQDTPFNWYKEDDRHCYGPGVIDMKGGLVAGLYALKALDACGLLSRIPITFLCNSDEEIGSPSSRALIRELARESCAAFVLECGGVNGEIVTGRKGHLSIRLKVKGKAGHAAFAGEDKASAILELAHKIIALEKLNRYDEGLTANVGKIRGGIGPNTVPDTATARVDFRYVTPSQKQHLENKISEICAHNTLSSTRTHVETVTKRPPMPQTDQNLKLYEIVRAAGNMLGMEIAQEYRQGVSDANIIALENVPVVDGLGPMGGRDHSEDEFMIKESLVERCILLSLAIIATHAEYYP
jgi:glutamate carboxypeptidase